MKKCWHDLRDTDGLISLKEFFSYPLDSRIWVSEVYKKKLYADPNIFGVSHLLASRPDLAEQARILLRGNEMGKKGAPIFGVPFSKALDLVSQAHVGALLRSVYKTDKAIGLSQLGIYATLVAHVRRTKDHIQIEAWQTSESMSETFYLHGFIDTESNFFTHFDGATMTHEDAEKKRIFEQGRKEKGICYQKWFRLDGNISQMDAVALARAFLPLEDLLVEYTQHIDDTGHA